MHGIVRKMQKISYIKLIGAVLMISVLSFNPLVIEQFFSPDKNIGLKSFIKIMVFDFSIAVLGFILFRYDKLIMKTIFRNKINIKKYLINIALLIITLLFFMVFLEIITRIGYNCFSDYNTEMWRYAVEIKQPSNNLNLPFEHAPYRKAFLYGAEINTNNEGFRADRDYTLNKSGDTFRILVLGDSVALGWGVNFNETYSQLLEKKFNQLNTTNFEVINLGIGNYNTAMELEILKDKGLKYNPDLIILGYYINDAEIAPEKLKTDLIGLIKSHSYLYALLGDKYLDLKIGSSADYNYTNYYSALYKEGFEGKNKAESALKEISEISKSNKISLIVVIFPEFHNFKDYAFQNATDFVTNISEQENIPYLDLLPYYKEYNPKDIWVSYEDAHPNTLGHKIAAEAIYSFIENKFLENEES